MENGNNLICIYDDTKEDIRKILLDIFANFIEKELENISSDKVRKICQERLLMIEEGKRDFRF